MTIKFIDLFAGIGGTRIGFENAAKKLNLQSKCVFTSEIKDYAVKVYKDNFQNEPVFGDITKIKSKDIPDFDILLAGFPCQPFSAAGSRKGFADTRGTLFFDIERILKDKNPYGFILENVEGLVKHDPIAGNPIGRTLTVILNNLTKLGYKVSWRLIDSSLHGVPQRRKRIYILGTKNKLIDLTDIPLKKSYLSQILEKGKDVMKDDFTKKLLKHFNVSQLAGKAIKDKRGGKNNVHSWDIDLKGKVSDLQKDILNKLLKERRKKIWAIKKNIKWMDGMPLTLDEIFSFYNKISKDSLKKELDDLVEKKYLRFEHPKESINIIENGGSINVRQHDTNKPPGYNIVAGKLSFPISVILSPEGVAPTLVATDVHKIAVIDGDGLRRLTIREGLRLFGFPENFNINLTENEAFDLLGNTVVVKIVEEVSKKLLYHKSLPVKDL